MSECDTGDRVSKYEDEIHVGILFIPDTIARTQTC